MHNSKEQSMEEPAAKKSRREGSIVDDEMAKKGRESSPTCCSKPSPLSDGNCRGNSCSFSADIILHIASFAHTRKFYLLLISLNKEIMSKARVMKASHPWYNWPKLISAAHDASHAISPDSRLILQTKQHIREPRKMMIFTLWHNTFGPGQEVELGNYLWSEFSNDLRYLVVMGVSKRSPEDRYTMRVFELEESDSLIWPSFDSPSEIVLPGVSVWCDCPRISFSPNSKYLLLAFQENAFMLEILADCSVLLRRSISVSHFPSCRLAACCTDEYVMWQDEDRTIHVCEHETTKRYSTNRLLPAQAHRFEPNPLDQSLVAYISIKSLSRRDDTNYDSVRMGLIKLKLKRNEKPDQAILTVVMGPLSHETRCDPYSYDHSPYLHILSLAWSHDGQYLIYNQFNQIAVNHVRRDNLLVVRKADSDSLRLILSASDAFYRCVPAFGDEYYIRGFVMSPDRRAMVVEVADAYPSYEFDPIPSRYIFCSYGQS